MFLAIEAQITPGSDLGYLLHKNPTRHYTRSSPVGEVHVLYPEVTATQAQALILLEVDPVAGVRQKRGHTLGMDQYVNDRSFVAGSLLSVALAQHLASALNGHAKERPERVQEALPLKLTLAAVASRGGPELFETLFTPLGYRWQVARYTYAEGLAEQRESPYYTLTLEHCLPLQKALQHLYILLPVLDRYKHYYYDKAEVEKLLRHGEGWLEDHPAQQLIVHRYLSHRPTLAQQALAQLASEDVEAQPGAEEQQLEAPLSLNKQRIACVVDYVNEVLASDTGAKRLIDLGCGEGQVLQALLKHTALSDIVGVDVSPHELERAERRLKLERLPEYQQRRLQLHQSSALYSDTRLHGADMVILVEVIEHLEPYQLERLARVVFGEMHAKRLWISTPNREYNTIFGMNPAHLRHSDHRFEWTRAEFQDWCQTQAKTYGYTVSFGGIGPEDAQQGHPTQWARFKEASHG